MINIDGNYLEGGGQIVRTALALSTITQKPFRVTNIRAGRPKPGLKAQHVTGVQALEKICNAQANGASLGSQTLEYIPGNIRPKNVTIDIGTAGSVTLLLQALLIPLMFADKQSKVTLIGGTNTKWSMPVEYVQNVFIPHVLAYVENIDLKVLRRGYYPKGGGKVELHVRPKVSRPAFASTRLFLEQLRKLPALERSRQYQLQVIQGVSHAARQLSQRQVAERQKLAAQAILKRLGVPVSIQVEYSATFSTGSGMTVWAKYATNDDIVPTVILGADELGEQRVSAEDVGTRCANKLLDEMATKAPVDKHLSDNLVPFLGLFGGTITVSSISNHLRTNIYVCEQFLPIAFSIEGNTISCELREL